MTLTRCHDRLDMEAQSVHKPWSRVNGFGNCMRIGELAKRTSLSRDTIRFYERSGLISSSPGGSRTNNYREYAPETVLTLDLVQQAKAAGLSLSDLVQLIEQFGDTSASQIDGETFLQRKIEEVEAKIEQSKKFLQTLQATKSALERAPYPD